MKQRAFYLLETFLLTVLIFIIAKVVFMIEIGLDFTSSLNSEVAAEGVFFPTRYSWNVFHSPHAGHLPIHFGLS